MCAAWIAPSASNAMRDVGVLVARLPGGEQVLAPVLDPLQRRADLRRREHQAHLVALHHDLLTEPAAGVAHHHPDAVLRDAEQPRAEQPHLVGRLRGRVDGELTGRRGSSRRRGRDLPSARARRPAGRSSRSPRGRRRRTRRRAPTPGRPAELADDVRAVGLRARARRRPRRRCSRRQPAAARSRRRRARPRPRRGTALSATTSATGSPTKRTSSSASGGRGVSGLARPTDVCHCSLTSGLRSAAVKTACTPGSASAADGVDPADASPGRTGCARSDACSIPGSTMSST